jgi:hypothetical protein
MADGEGRGLGKGWDHGDATCVGTRPDLRVYRQRLSFSGYDFDHPPRLGLHRLSSRDKKQGAPANPEGETEGPAHRVALVHLCLRIFPYSRPNSLKSKLGNEISFWTAFFSLAVMVLLATLGDLVVLDWLVVSKITPRFVIIPGSEKADYRDFSHHYKAHVKAAVALVLVSLAMAAIISHF